MMIERQIDKYNCEHYVTAIKSLGNLYFSNV